MNTQLILSLMNTQLILSLMVTMSAVDCQSSVTILWGLNQIALSSACRNLLTDHPGKACYLFWLGEGAGQLALKRSSNVH